MRNKKLQVWLPLVLSICMVAGMFIGYRIKGNMPNKGIFFMEKQKPVQEVLDLIQRKYVDKENLDSLGNVAIQTILAGLDPHSVYLPARELKAANEGLSGMFFGIGVEFNILADTTHVVHVLEGGPSQKAGLIPGDKLIRVEDSLIAGNNTGAETLRDLLRGSNGSVVNVTLMRGRETKKVSITRGAIPIYSLDAAYMLTDTIGYIRLNKFAETTYKEFMRAMEKLQGSGMKSLVFDLRDNGGGILTEATHIADEFLSGDKLITYTEGANHPKKEYRCDKEGVFETGKLIVLANEGTASASEVIIGALQDWERATIIGRRSFGKGLVQEQYELSDGSGLRLTVARYFTPLGRGIQKSYKNGNKAYDHDLMDRYRSGELSYMDSIKHTDAEKYTTHTGKVLYGGGGITPDIFVGIDTTSFDEGVMKALLNGTLGRFSYINYLDQKPAFAGYTSPSNYNDKFVVDAATLRRLKDHAAKDSIYLNVENPLQQSQLAKQIKVLTARLIWRTEGFYMVNNTYDDMVKMALNFLTSDTLVSSKK